MVKDPRLKDFQRLANTVNGVVTDRAIRHALFLERLKAHHVNEIVKFLNNQVFPDILRQTKGELRRIINRPKTFQDRRLRELAQANYQVLRVGMRTARGRFSDDLKALALSEAEWQTSVLRTAVPSVFGLDFVTPAPALLEQLVTSSPFEGKVLREWFDDVGRYAGGMLNKEIKLGIAAGESIPTIVRRVRGIKDKGVSVFGKVRNASEAVVRTAVAQVTNDVRFKTFEANSDVVKGWQFVATLDAGTTEICMSLDGNTYLLGEGGADQPPLHFRCRSMGVPWLRSWKELGIKLKEPPPGTRMAKQYRDGKKAMNGRVPEKTTYPEWWKQQSRDAQNKALGIGKADIMRRGKVPWTDLVDGNGNPLTLKELIELEASIVG